MKAILNGTMPLPKGGFLKNPFVVHNGEKKDTNKGVYEINFDLCVNQEHEKKIDSTGETTIVQKTHVIKTFTHYFGDFEKDAIIVVDGNEIPLVQHLSSGGELIQENVKDWGHPKYNELGAYFMTDFTDVIFKPGPFEFLSKTWALNTIKFFGKTMMDWGFEWE